MKVLDLVSLRVLHTQQKKYVSYAYGALYFEELPNILLDSPKSNNERKKLLPKSIFLYLSIKSTVK